MISVNYPPHPSEETVLDLCVRKAEKRFRSPTSYETDFADVKREKSASPSRGFHFYDGKGQEEPLDYARTDYSPDYSATVKLLQQRLYDGEHESPQPSPDHKGLPSMSPHSITSPVSFIKQAAQVSTTSVMKGKPTRPFKAYPKNPLAMAPDGLISDSSQDYAEFRRQMLQQVRAATGNTTNKNMKRPVNSVSPDGNAPSSSDSNRDSAYWDRRRKNNEAAKRSRDARRAKEDELAIRAAFLEQENVKLKYEISALGNKLKYEVTALSHENERLRNLLYKQ